MDSRMSWWEVQAFAVHAMFGKFVSVCFLCLNEYCKAFIVKYRKAFIVIYSMVLIISADR